MIFILGGNGFVGSAISRYCASSKIDFKVVTRENYENLKGEKCNVLINANGNSKKYLAKDQPLVEFDASVRSVRASLIDFKFDFYVHLSSCDVYPDCSSPDITREDRLISVEQQSPYGFHKYLSELCVRNLASKWLVIRMGGFVGPGLVKNPIFDILRGGPLWLDPASELQFMHTDTFASILFELIEQKVTNRVVNVCGVGTVALKDLILQVGIPVSIVDGCPKVHYEISTDLIRSITQVPQSRSTALEFVQKEMVSQALSRDNL